MPADHVAVDNQVSAPLRGVVPLKKSETRDVKGYQGVFAYRGGTILVRISGDIAAGVENVAITDYLRETIGQLPGQVTVFFDLESFKHYHSSVRIRYTDAVLAHSAKVQRIWVYADAMLVRMGASVAAIALRQLILADRSKFDAELSRSIR
jgi:hypothetical protein